MFEGISEIFRREKPTPKEKHPKKTFIQELNDLVDRAIESGKKQKVAFVAKYPKPVGAHGVHTEYVYVFPYMVGREQTHSVLIHREGLLKGGLPHEYHSFIYQEGRFSIYEGRRQVGKAVPDSEPAVSFSGRTNFFYKTRKGDIVIGNENGCEKAFRIREFDLYAGPEKIFGREKVHVQIKGNNIFIEDLENQ